MHLNYFYLDDCFPYIELETKYVSIFFLSLFSDRITLPYETKGTSFCVV